MKVVYISNSEKGGGAEQFAYDMSVSHLIGGTLFVKDNKRKESKAVKIERSSMSYFMNGMDALLKKLFKKTYFADIGVIYPLHATYLSLKKNKDYQEADIVCIHNIHSGYFDLETLRFFAKDGKRIVWILHDMWVLTGGEVYTFEDEGYQIGNALSTDKSLFAVENPISDRRQVYMEKKKALFEELVEAITFVPVSNWLEGCLNHAYTIPVNAHIHTILNGIDTSVFFNKKKRTWNKPRLLFFNSSNPFKGSHLFAEIACEFQGIFDLYIVGKQLEGVDKQKYLDPIYDRSRLNDLYNEVDILLFPSEAENFPLTVLEAMSAGVYVLGAEVGGIKEQLAEGRGILFAPSSSEALKNTLHIISKQPLNELRVKGESASKVTQELYSKDDMFLSYHNLFEELFQKK